MYAGQNLLIFWFIFHFVLLVIDPQLPRQISEREPRRQREHSHSGGMYSICALMYDHTHKSTPMGETLTNLVTIIRDTSIAAGKVAIMWLALSSQRHAGLSLQAPLEQPMCSLLPFRVSMSLWPCGSKASHFCLSPQEPEPQRTHQSTEQSYLSEVC